MERDARFVRANAPDGWSGEYKDSFVLINSIIDPSSGIERVPFEHFHDQIGISNGMSSLLPIGQRGGAALPAGGIGDATRWSASGEKSGEGRQEWMRWHLLQRPKMRSEW